MLRMKRDTRVYPGVLPLPLDTSDEAEGIARSEEKPSSEDLLSAGARQMLHAALEIEVKAYIENIEGKIEDLVHGQAVRNGNDLSEVRQG